MLLEKLLKVKRVVIMFLSLLILTSLFQYPVIASGSNTTSTKATTTKNAVIRANNSTIKVGASFNPMKNVSAKDNGGSGKSLTSKIKVSGTVNTKVAGNYKVTYKVAGANGKVVTKIVTVTVVGATTNTTKTTTSNKLTEKEVYNRMISLKKKYPDGTSWPGDKGYEWKGGIYSKGYGCAGFAMMLSDVAFGDLPARKTTDFKNIRVGDILRINNDTRSVIVLSIDGTDITLAEGAGVVNWGRVITLDNLLKTGTYVLTRYPS